MTQSNASIAQKEWIEIHTSITRLETKLDMIFAQNEARLNNIDNHIVEMRKRVEALEGVNQKQAGKLSVIAFGVSSVSTAAIGTIFKIFFMNS